MKISIRESERQIIFVMVFLAVVGIFYVRQINNEIVLGEQKDQEILAYEESIRPFLNLALAAQSFVIYDSGANNFIYKKNAEIKLPLASLAKVMSAIVVLENAPADKTFEISKESLSQSADHGLLLGEKWGRDDLLEFALFVSSNDAIHQMALETGRLIDPASVDPIGVFVDKMNAKAAELDLRSFVFKNESGLDISPTENGAYGSARDMARLFAYAVKTYPEVFVTTSKKVATIVSADKSHNVDNTNMVVEEIPGILASKTGFTDISGGNLVVATSSGETGMRIVVVMGSTYDERFTDVQTLTGAVANFRN